MKTFNFLLILFLTLFSSSIVFAQVEGISVLDVKTGVIKEVANLQYQGAFNATFSNNGKKIAFDSWNGTYSEVFVTDLTNGDIYPLEGGIFGNDPSWSPDGEYIVFDRWWYQIVVVPSYGGYPEMVAYGTDAEWNNTSEKIVFNEFGFGLRTINMDGSGYTYLTNFGGNPSWSPNGNHVAFTDGNNLWIVDVDDYGYPVGYPYQITFDQGQVFNQQPSWANNSKSLVFHSNRETDNFEFDLWSIDIASGIITRLAGYEGFGDYDPCYSKNGQYVAFSTRGSSNQDAVTRSAEASIYQNYPNPFKTSTTLTINVEKSGMVQLIAYDQLGRMVGMVQNSIMDTGVHEVVWNPAQDGALITGGIYTLQLITPSGIQTSQVVYTPN